MTTLPSRAVMLLQKELFKIQQFNLWGIEIEVDDENLFHWKVIMSGLKDTIWEESKLILILKFNEDFKKEPPHVFFQTIPLHPNIDETTGSICMGVLEQWREDFCIFNLLLVIQNILVEPIYTNAINRNATVLMTQHPAQYKQMVSDCVLQSQRYQDLITLQILLARCLSDAPTTEPLKNTDCSFSVNPSLCCHSIHDIKKSPSLSETHTKPTSLLSTTVKQHGLSYDEYLSSWKKTGATKTLHEAKNPLLNVLGSRDFTLNDYDLIKNDVNDEIYRQLSEHRRLMFGQFNHNGDTKISNRNLKKKEVLKTNKTQLLKDSHIHKNDTSPLNVAASTSRVKNNSINRTQIGKVFRPTDGDGMNAINAKE